jgi:hypothetical protein
MKYALTHPITLFACLWIAIGSVFYYYSDDIQSFGRGALDRFDHIIEYKGQHR